MRNIDNPIFPQGCKKIRNGAHVELLLRDDNYVMEEKIDGIRCVVYCTKDKIMATTRGYSVNDPSRPIDITHRIPLIIKDFKDHMPLMLPEDICIFDGELIIPGLTAAQMAGYANHKSDKVVPDTIRYKIFDYITYEDMRYEKRRELLVFYKFYFTNSNYLDIVDVVKGENNKRDFMADIFSRGIEGVVFKNIDAIYDPGGKHVNNWYKHKKKDTIDAKIIGNNPPEKYYVNRDTGKKDLFRYTKAYTMGWIGSLKCQLEDGTIVNVSGMSDKIRQMFSEYLHIGRIVELEFMEKTDKGLLRSPRFIRLREEVEK